MIDEFIKPVNPLPGSEDAQVPAPNQAGKPATPEELSATPRTAHAQDLTAIDNTNHHFKGQQKNEVVYAFCRKHWIVLLPHFIGFIFIALANLLFLIFADGDAIGEVMSRWMYRTIALIGLIGLSIYLHSFFVRIFNYYLQILIITNFRIVQLDQTLFFTRNRDSIDIREIQDMVIEQKGVFKTLLNYGELIITLSSAHATKRLRHVPNPEYHFRKINKTKREYISKRQEEKAK